MPLIGKDSAAIWVFYPVCELLFCICCTSQYDVNSRFLAFTAEYSPFLGIEKGAVLQEARVFNDPQLDPRRCSQVWAL